MSEDRNPKLKDPQSSTKGILNDLVDHPIILTGLPLSSDKKEISRYETVSKKVIEYAREHIKAGNLEFVKSQEPSAEVVVDVSQSELKDQFVIAKQKVDVMYREVREALDKESQDFLRLDLDDAIYKFDLNIEIIKKHRAGNCAALAIMGLDYVLNHEPNLTASVFRIRGGDHRALFLKWPDANEEYVVDPLIGVFYLKAEIEKKLQNYEHSASEGLITIKPYKPEQGERVEKVPGENTDILGKRNNEEYQLSMKKVYRQKIGLMSEAVNAYIQDLTKLQEKLPPEKTAYLKKISDKIRDAKALCSNILARHFEENKQSDVSTYHPLKIFLQNSLQTYLDQIRILPANLKIDEYKEPTNLIDKLTGFFKKPPQLIAIEGIDAAAQKLNENLKKLQGKPELEQLRSYDLKVS